jgi:HlyD family secretion protein
MAAANRNAMVEPASQAQIFAAQSQIIAAEAARLPIQSAYNQLPEGTAAETVEQLQLQLNAAQAQVNAAQAALAQLQTGASPAQQQAANAVVSAAAAQRDAAQARLDLLLAGPKPEQEQLAEIEVSQAEALVAQAELAVVQAEEGVVEAQTGVARAQIAWEVAQAALEQTILRAPFAGVITQLAAKPGEVVGVGAPVLTLADFSGWQVMTNDLTELDVVLLQTGLPVTVQLEALPGETLRGQVVDIASVSRLNQGDVTYVATILLDETNLPVRWGMTALVEININGGE